MKIDLHVHTKKTKSGDALSRNIDPDRFYEILTSTSVKIVAITNHNVFDVDQFNELKKRVGQEVQIWPGIELDVIEEGRRGHLIVIVSPSQSDTFSAIVNRMVVGSTPDSFTISIEDVISKFEDLAPIYVAHYKHKKPDLLDKSIKKLVDGVRSGNRVIKEATNAISAGIYINHGHKSIYGSDLQDWNEYETIAKDLPELRLPVESFEQFCLLLEKDAQTINTILDKKTPEIISISPFEDNTVLELKVYNDINIWLFTVSNG